MELLLVRHGQSLGNLASEAAATQGLSDIDLDVRDADVELSDRGQDQAHALGLWLASMPTGDGVDSVWCSPFERARRTYAIAAKAAGLELPVVVDERLRDRDLGVLDLLTTHGITDRFPEEAVRRERLGKFYYRPPGGESWADLALRVRAVLTDLERLESGRRVLIVCHDAVILSFRYVCEQLSEAEVLDISASRGVSHTGVTHLASPADPREPWWLVEFDQNRHNDTQPEEGR